MRIVLVLNGREESAEVELDRRVVRVRDREFPFQIHSDSIGRTELEIAGERVVVEGWPSGFPDPPPQVSLNGEVERVTRVERRRTGDRPQPIVEGATVTPTEGSRPVTVASSADAILPPMPGRVIEVRVREGEKVEGGTVLLVLEAMKMRNEIVSPRSGVIRDLSVSPGANVRAKDRLLRVADD